MSCQGLAEQAQAQKRRHDGLLIGDGSQLAGLQALGGMGEQIERAEAGDESGGNQPQPGIERHGEQVPGVRDDLASGVYLRHAIHFLGIGPVSYTHLQSAYDRRILARRNH